MMKIHSHVSKVRKKKFKSKHSSKGELKRQSNGKTASITPQFVTKNKIVSKNDKLNRKKQIRQQKVINNKEVSQNFLGVNGIERIVTIVGLSDDVIESEIADNLFNNKFQNSNYKFSESTFMNISIEIFKTKLKIIIPNKKNILEILDSIKISDFVIFGLSALKEVDSYGESILRASISQGVPIVIGLITNLISSFPKKKHQINVKQSLQHFFSFFFTNENKLLEIETDKDRELCLRTICQKKPANVCWRDNRGYLVSDEINFFVSDLEEYTIVFKGIVRGTGFDVNRNIYIPGYGEFIIDKIERFSKKSLNLNEKSNDVFFPSPLKEEVIDEESDYKIEIDDNDSIDNFKFQDNLESNISSKNKKKLFKGASEYQSRWLKEIYDSESENSSILLNNSEMSDIELKDESDHMIDDFDDIPTDDEKKQLLLFKQNDKEYFQYPDEFDLDPKCSAVETLKEYKSLNTLIEGDHDYSHDPEFSKISNDLLKINNYFSTKKYIYKNSIINNQVCLGDKVKIFIKVPISIFNKLQSSSQKFVSIYGLLKGEDKNSICDFFFEKWEGFEEPISSDENLIVQYGFRREIIQPMFNTLLNQKEKIYKYLPFFDQNKSSVLSTISPVIFNQSPAIFFKTDANNQIIFVGKGEFLKCNHSKFITNRIVLTGYPYKIYKKIVVVRYMFFNSDDVNSFKSIPLITNTGKLGFIKESLGTHGYFKATFNKKIFQSDIIMIELHKRVWPNKSSLCTL